MPKHFFPVPLASLPLITFSFLAAAGLLAVEPKNLRSATPDRSALSGTELYRQAAAASVEVLVGGRLNGSGWFADPRGLIVTASHVVWNQQGKLEITSPTLGRLEVKLLAVDRGHDLALLEAPARKSPYPALPLAETMPEPTTEIYLFGAPLFRHEILLTGKITKPTPTYEFRSDMKCFVRMCLVEGTSPKGTSGGCWLNAKGQAVGVQSGMVTVKESSVGIADVAPPDAIRRLVQTRQSAQTADLGGILTELWEQPVKFIERFPAGTEGLAVVMPYEGGPLHAAGITKDSVLLAVEGRPLPYRDTLLDFIRTQQPGHEISLRVLQPNDPVSRDVKVKLACLETAETK